MVLLKIRMDVTKSFSKISNFYRAIFKFYICKYGAFKTVKFIFTNSFSLASEYLTYYFKLKFRTEISAQMSISVVLRSDIIDEGMFLNLLSPSKINVVNVGCIIKVMF